MDVPPDGGGGDRPAFHQNVRFIVHDERSAPKPVAVASGSSADTRMVIDLTGDDASTRPTNQEIKEQENKIRDEMLQQPGIGAVEEMSSLLKEYAEGAENEVFREKIGQLEKSFTAMRRTRGDGNCFFRSVLFSYIEQCLLLRDTHEILRFRDVITKSKDNLIAQGFQALVFEDALELVVDLLGSLTATPEPLSLDGLVGKFSDAMLSNYMIMFFRLIASAEVRRRAEFFEPFILGLVDVPISVQKFCQETIEPMGNESDHIEAHALTDALGVAVRVVYLDRTRHIGDDGEVAVNHHDFIPGDVEAARPGQPPSVVVLYRPGHYDVLYAKQQPLQ